MSQDRMRLAPVGPVSRSLRAAIRDQGWAVQDLAERAGVLESVLQQFVHNQGGLTLATVDSLAAALRLTLGPDELSRPAGTPDPR